MVARTDGRYGLVKVEAILGVAPWTISFVGSMPWVCLSVSSGFHIGAGRAPLPVLPRDPDMPSDPHSGHSGSGKTETARKLVEFLSSLQQKPTRDRRCQVRGHWHDLASIQEGSPPGTAPGPTCSEDTVRGTFSATPELEGPLRRTHWWASSHCPPIPDCLLPLLAGQCAAHT